MRISHFLLSAGLLSGAIEAGAGIDGSLRHARAAEARLGSAVWTQVVRIENENPRSRYPRVLHALVFELAGILWFYADVDGTQSLSLHRDRSEQDKSNLAPLLLAIDPGFRTWEALPAATVGRASQDVDLPNGCFIASVAEWQRLARTDPDVSAPKLLSFYGGERVEKRGHTVLVYATGDRIAVVDPQKSSKRHFFPRMLAQDPLRLARAVAGPHVVEKARFLALPDPMTECNRYTACPADGEKANASS